MTEQVSQQNQDLILKLDAARASEIGNIRTNMETFLRGQLELEHKMEIVAANQNGMKERMEQGLSKTLFNLDKKFDALLIEWGTKKAEDVQRDKEIKSNGETTKLAHGRIDKILNGFAVAVISGIVLWAVVEAATKLVH